MKVILTGGGSGGHITPLLAIAHELHRIDPQIIIVFVGLRGDKFSELPATDPNISAVFSIRAGKFRRYHTQGLKQILDMSTLIKNIRDFIFVGIGLVQSWFLLRKIRPDVIFTRGAYVGVPLCAAASRKKIPIITHDSDVLPGLSNRIVSRWASVHAVAMPKQYYKYPLKKTVTVGVPVGYNYQFVTDELKKKFRQEINVEEDKQLLLVTGGGLGAQKINETVVQAAPKLLSDFEDLVLIHNTGTKHETTVTEAYSNLPENLRNRVIVRGFIDDLYRYSGAADLIITRAGATTIAELAMQAKPAIVVPNPYLTAGHQIKNAEILAQSGAAEIIPENRFTPQELFDKVDSLLGSREKRQKLSQAINQLAYPDSSKKIAQLLVEAANTNHK
jgi:UDP-N-acetylglucosamine--N-acetylmuramyl-(pentapeptide) pyrophosphoryl-undecaprenol N-acetylglucosamine transferase